MLPAAPTSRADAEETMNPSTDSPRNVPSPVACCGWGHWGSETTTLLNTVDALHDSATRRDSSLSPQPGELDVFPSPSVSTPAPPGIAKQPERNRERPTDETAGGHSALSP